MRQLRVYLYKDGDLVSSSAIYGDELSVEITREDEEMYRRTKIKGTLTFVNDDYDTIHDADIDAEFKVVVAERLSGNGIFSEVVAGVFYKADCEFNDDDKIVSVSPSQVDDYDKILKGIDKTYNLIKLAPIQEEIFLQKRPIIQLYMKGDSKVTNLIGNMSYEVDVNSEVDYESVTASQLSESYNFTRIHKLYTHTFSGEYDWSGVWYSDGATLENGAFSVEIVHRIIQQAVFYSLELYEDGVSTGYYTRWSNTSPNFTSSYNYGTYENRSSLTSTFTVAFTDTVVERGIYGRIIHDSDSSAVPTVDKYLGWDGPDIVANNVNYKYSSLIGLAVPDVARRVVVSQETQSSPTEWGINDNGKYFVAPSTYSDGTAIGSSASVIPIGWNLWSPASFWFISEGSYDGGRIAWFSMKEGIPLYSAIQKLLAEVDDSIEFSNTTDYSQFLFGTSGFALNHPLYITPVTNVKNSTHNQAAQRGDISLRQILNMLRSCFRCYWWIEPEYAYSETVSPSTGQLVASTGAILANRAYAQIVMSRGDFVKVSFPSGYLVAAYGNEDGYGSAFTQTGFSTGGTLALSTSYSMIGLNIVKLSGEEITEADMEDLLTLSEETTPKRLRIEHVKYFRNGGSYSSDERVVLQDLTTLKSPLPNKVWSYGQNKYKYDTSSLCSRYEFGWGSPCSDVFNGFPIDIKNSFCEAFGTEKITVDNFVSDIDFILGAPDQINDDTYALIEVIRSTKRTWTQRVSPISLASLSYPMYWAQNGALSFIYLAECETTDYYQYDMSADEAYVGEVGAYLNVEGTKRTIVQTVTCPYTTALAKSEGLITTGLGSGEVISVELNLNSLEAKLTLLFDTN